MQTILIADDAEVNREILTEVLKNDYHIETASNGQEALVKIEQLHGNIVAFLLDLHMPKFDGFKVMEFLQAANLIDKIPILIITGENSTEIETICFEMGVFDFIRKPFNTTIISNRVKNAVSLYACKNQLQETVIKQEKIIAEQSCKLMDISQFDELMMHYRCAMMELETKLRVLNEEFTNTHNRNPIETIKTRLKSPNSIYGKLKRRGIEPTIENIESSLFDIAGLRVICSFPDDIYQLVKYFEDMHDIVLIEKKDYIENPKPNGYRSLHLILDVPIYLSTGIKYMKAEIQFRTIAMDFWASLEHKLNYKKDNQNVDSIVNQLRDCAKSIENLDYRMQEIQQKIENHNKS